LKNNLDTKWNLRHRKTRPIVKGIWEYRRMDSVDRKSWNLIPRSNTNIYIWNKGLSDLFWQWRVILTECSNICQFSCKCCRWYAVHLASVLMSINNINKIESVLLVVAVVLYNVCYTVLYCIANAVFLARAKERETKKGLESFTFIILDTLVMM